MSSGAPGVELAVVVPTFNERENVAELVRRLEGVLRDLRWEVVFVDDDSPDGTAAAVRALAQADARVRCVQRFGRRGLSRAVVEGILATSAPLVAVMDADLQHDEALLPDMVARLRAGVEVVVGTRYGAGGDVGDWTESRARLSRLGTVVARRLLHASVSDPMSGFFALRRETFESVARRLSGEGYKLLLDLLATLPAGVRIEELSYRFRPRLTGESKLDSAVLWEFAMLLIDKRIGHWIPARFLLFSLVGASGVVVHFGVLVIAYRWAGMAFPQAQTLATLTAMTSNYFLNNTFTYRDRRHRGMSWLGGLLTFYAICGLGVIGNVGVASMLFARQGWALAAAAGTLVGTVWNYVASKAVTWRSA